MLAHSLAAEVASWKALATKTFWTLPVMKIWFYPQTGFKGFSKLAVSSELTSARLPARMSTSKGYGLILGIW